MTSSLRGDAQRGSILRPRPDHPASGSDDLRRNPPAPADLPARPRRSARCSRTTTPFPEPTSLLVQPDHYILRMLYSRGVPLEQLGVPTRDGTAVERDPRRMWSTFAAHYYLFRGTPTGAWLDHELIDVFGIRTRLIADSADADLRRDRREAARRPNFVRARCSTDSASRRSSPPTAAADSLEHHQAIRDVRVERDACFRASGRTPSFRSPNRDWRSALDALE